MYVLSIPDYAFTPFGNANPYISEAIDEFNAVNSFITNVYNISYLNITPISRNGLQQPDLVASDGLHPSGLQYQLRVQEMLEYVERMWVSLKGSIQMNFPFTFSKIINWSFILKIIRKPTRYSIVPDEKFLKDVLWSPKSGLTFVG